MAIYGDKILNFKHRYCGKMSKYGVISGPYFSVLSTNTGKYGPEITPYLEAFHAVRYMQRHYINIAAQKMMAFSS